MCHMPTNKLIIISMIMPSFFSIVFPFFFPNLLLYMYLLTLVPPLIGTMLRLLQICSESTPDDGGEDEQLQTLSEIMAELLSDVCLLISEVFLNRRTSAVKAVTPFCSVCTFLLCVCVFQMTQETVADSVKNGYLTEKTSLTAAACLVPNFNTAVSVKSQEMLIS